MPNNNLYLDYAGLQHYHHNLEIEFDNLAISANEIDAIFPADRTFTPVYFKIKLASEYFSSEPSYDVAVEWTASNFLALKNNTEYTFYNAFNTQHTYYYNEQTIVGDLDGLCIELYCRDESDNMHYYTTAGRHIYQCSASEYDSWNGALAQSYGSSVYKVYGSGFWNYVDLELPAGKSQGFHLNYQANSPLNYSYYDDYSDEEYAEDLEEKEAGFLASNEFEVTLIRSTEYDYSVILHWEC